jgi:hypothetical protein
VYYAINAASKLNGEEVLRIASPDGKQSYKLQISEALLRDDSPAPDLLGRLLAQKDIASRIKQQGSGQPTELGASYLTAQLKTNRLTKANETAAA